MRSIRDKLFITYALLLVLAIALAGSGFTWFLRSFYLDTLRQRLTEEARVTGELVAPLLADDAALAETDSFVRRLGQKTNARITVILPDGTVAADTQQDRMLMDNHLNRPEIRGARQGVAGSAMRYSSTLREHMFYVAVSLHSEGENVGFLRVALPLLQLNRALQRVLLGLAGGLALVLLLTLGISLKLSDSLTRPLKRIADVAEQIAHGDPDSRIYLPNRDEIGVLAVSINKMAESLQERVREVESGKEQLETVLSTMVEGVIVFDGSGKTVMVNPAAEQMLGLENKNWFGRSSLEMIRNVELHEKITAVSRERAFLEHEITTVYPEQKVLSITLVPVKTDGTGLVGTLAVFHDITRLRRLEGMRADFAANVSHELRTPLTAIRGFAETLLDGTCQEPQSVQRFARIIHREAERLGHLIEDVLKLSQIESGKLNIAMTPVDGGELVREVTGMFSERWKEYKLKVQIPSDLPFIRGDRGLLSQALYNLLDNAIKYTQSGGTISVTGGREGGLVKLAVSDNGIGIAEQEKERIFERFYRVDRARSRRKGGTGLGLAIVKHIVDAHNGKIILESSEGKGTTVALCLPAADGKDV